MKAVFAALFAAIVGCTSVQPTSAAEAVSFKEKVLYSFCSQRDCTDGQSPYVSLIDVNGMLYGTTANGGRTGCGGNGCGTAFSLDPSTGAENVLYSFCSQTNCADGANPSALIDVNGSTLYGTTVVGGSHGCGNGSGCGTVFSLDLKTGAEKVLYSFAGGTDGALPYASLIDVKGALYGTTNVGGGAGCGGNGCGTVCALYPKSGAEKVLYSFAGGEDGVFPYASLIDVKETLYGTTFLGGAAGGGTVFTVNRKTGAEKVLYSFCSQWDCPDGWGPNASLIDVNGTLYGTSLEGGTYPGTFGTVFAIDPNNGTEKVLHSFGSGDDGQFPTASVIAVNGTLYGATENGGGTGCGGGCGTVFSLDPSTGAETVLYSFLGGTDGQYPYASLIDVNGKLYGTTVGGGSGTCGGSNGCGTVFVLKKKR